MSAYMYNYVCIHDVGTYIRTYVHMCTHVCACIHTSPYFTKDASRAKLCQHLVVFSSSHHSHQPFVDNVHLFTNLTLHTSRDSIGAQSHSTGAQSHSTGTQSHSTGGDY